MKLFEKYTSFTYGIKHTQYYFEDYIPYWLEYNFKRYVLRAWHIIFGHKWGKWGKFSYVPKGKTGFATMSERNSRHCSCYAKDYKNWSKKEQRQLAIMRKRWGKAMESGYIGHIYGVRFMQTTTVKPHQIKIS